tara:strand:- start:196 stop:321 length:126 start_codon:yes stop_codon:yes gene_type:complete
VFAIRRRKRDQRIGLLRQQASEQARTAASQVLAFAQAIITK